MSSFASMSPLCAALYEPDFTLTVTGTGFISGTSLITFDGVNQPTTFVNATTLTTPMSPRTETDLRSIDVSVSDAPSIKPFIYGPPSSSPFPGQLVGVEPYEFWQINGAVITLVGTCK